MSPARIVLETSGERKSALVEAASLQGATLTDWFEEQVAGELARSPHYGSERLQEIKSVDELGDPRSVFESLSSRDWSFTEDDTRYLTHDLHPYPAKFIPQIPAHLIARLSMPGDMVLDPFGGSATTAVEAVRLGRRAISFDANPLSALIGRVKTGYMASSVRTDLDQLCAAIDGHIINFGTHEQEWASHLTSRHGKYLPDIPNVAKWFEDYIVGELCLVRHLIEETTAGLARDAAYLALSRVIIRISHQESETRYVSVPKQLRPTIALRAYLESLKAVTRRLEQAAIELQFADARYLVGDSRYDLTSAVGENCIDLIVTSPPYPNATDYHLYHRFRLFWLGFDPRALGKIEIGSHLRHQRNETGFEEYQEDMALALDGCCRVLAPGRYAVFVVGDAIFKGRSFSTSDAIALAARNAGLEVLGVIDRPIHRTKRSFAKPARRARSEQLVVLRKPNRPIRVHLNPPAYRMWPYEGGLRVRETESLIGCPVDADDAEKPIVVRLKQPALWHLRRLTFTRDFVVGSGNSEAQATWQRVLENGDADPTKRKDPKYVTHGLHAFKGKFYPQLVKSLLNSSGVPVEGSVLDPYCGSGTTLLEGMLNGFRTYGCDFNPLAAKIAHAKTGVLAVPRNVVGPCDSCLPIPGVASTRQRSGSTRSVSGSDARGADQMVSVSRVVQAELASGPGSSAGDGAAGRLLRGDRQQSHSRSIAAGSSGPADSQTQGAARRRARSGDLRATARAAALPSSEVLGGCRPPAWSPYPANSHAGGLPQTRVDGVSRARAGQRGLRGHESAVRHCPAVHRHGSTVAAGDPGDAFGDAFGPRGATHRVQRNTAQCEGRDRGGIAGWRRDAAAAGRRGSVRAGHLPCQPVYRRRLSDERTWRRCFGATSAI